MGVRGLPGGVAAAVQAGVGALRGWGADLVPGVEGRPQGAGLQARGGAGGLLAGEVGVAVIGVVEGPQQGRGRVIRAGSGPVSRLAAS